MTVVLDSWAVLSGSIRNGNKWGWRRLRRQVRSRHWGRTAAMSEKRQLGGKLSFIKQERGSFTYLAGREDILACREAIFGLCYPENVDLAGSMW